jgi:hypothetical protein
MKKLLFLFMTLAYMVSATGATLYVHHCMGKVVDWDFKKDGVENCTNCGMHKNDKNDCCKDEMRVLKMDNAQKQPEAARYDIGIKDIFLPLTWFALVQQNFQFVKHSFPLVVNMPQQVVPDLCVLHCTYLI